LRDAPGGPAGAAAGSGASSGGGRSTSRRLSFTGWALRPASGIAFAGVLAVAIAIVVATNPSGQSGQNYLPAIANRAIGAVGRAPAASTPSTAAGARFGSSAATTAQLGSLKPASGVKLAPSTVRQGGSCASGTAGCTGGKFTGNFFNNGANTPSATYNAPPAMQSPASHGAATTPSSSASSGPVLDNTLATKSSGAAGRSSSAGSASSAPPVLAPSAPTAGAAAQAITPSPTPNGRKQIQSAQLQLMTPGRWIDTVSQELFTVVGNENGVVKTSQITQAGGNGANGGYADFQLSIPSANLATTMTQLSELRYAHVVARTDATQDVNGPYLYDQRQLADARALRTSLLKQLAQATTSSAIASITAQIHDAEASIGSDEATVNSLNSKINFSNLSVQINAGPVPLPVATPSSHGFTIGKAWHDSKRVLDVSAGVALITLAVLIPIGLVVALGLWIGATVRRRRREHALDAA
jgi:hypothetical protein